MDGLLVIIGQLGGYVRSVWAEGGEVGVRRNRSGEPSRRGPVKVVVSATLSSYDKRYVVVDEATGEVVDDAQGYGYKNAQNAHRAYAYKSMPPKKTHQRDAAKRRVQRWCAQHAEFMQHVEQAMFYAMKDGENVTVTDVRAILAEHGLELPFPVKDLMKHW